MIRFTGPILYRELLGGLRTKRAFVILLVFNLAVAAAVLNGWHSAEGKPWTRADVGTLLFKTISLTEVALITLLAPALSGGAITLEREGRTLDLLRTTPIPTHRLLLEKFLASVVFFIILLVTASPLTSIAIILGGVEPSDVLAVLATLLLLIGACGAVGIVISTAFLRTHSAVAVTYILVLPLGGVCGVALAKLDPRALGVAALAVGIAGVGVVLLLGAVARRLVDVREEGEVEPESFEDVAVHAGLLMDRRVFPDRLIWPPRRNEPIPDGANPVLEKELRLEAPGRSGRFISILIQGGMYLCLPVMIFPVFLLGEGMQSSQGAAVHALAYPLYLLSFVLLIGPALSSTGFSGERERKTLDGLLVTPLAASRVVGGKALASLRGSLGMTLLLACPFIFYSLISSFAREGKGFQMSWETLLRFPLLLAILGTTLVAISTSGTWISLVSRNSLRAMSWTYALVTVVAVLPLVLHYMVVPLTEIPYAGIQWTAVPCPVTAIISAAAAQGGPQVMAVDAEGGLPTWARFLVFWAVVNPVLVLGSLRAYRRRSGT